MIQREEGNALSGELLDMSTEDLQLTLRVQTFQDHGPPYPQNYYEPNCDEEKRAGIVQNADQMARGGRITLHGMLRHYSSSSS